MNTCIEDVLNSRTRSLTLATSLLIEDLIELAKACEIEVCLISLKDSLTRFFKAQKFVCRHVENDIDVKTLNSLLAAIKTFCRICLISDIVVKRHSSDFANMT
jgi:hypothetical protein